MNFSGKSKPSQNIDFSSSSVISEFATPSEALAVVEYITNHYLLNISSSLSTENVIELQDIEKDEVLCTVSPLAGQWSESLPDERLVLRGSICKVSELSRTSPYELINELNCENPDIKLTIRPCKGESAVYVERIFSMVGGVTANNLIETLLEFIASQSLLIKALS